MVAYETKLGSVCISNTFFAKLIGQAVSSCYGVSGMVAKGTEEKEFFIEKNQKI